MNQPFLAILREVAILLQPMLLASQADTPLSQREDLTGVTLTEGELRLAASARAVVDALLHAASPDFSVATLVQLAGAVSDLSALARTADASPLFNVGLRMYLSTRPTAVLALSVLGLYLPGGRGEVGGIAWTAVRALVSDPRRYLSELARSNWLAGGLSAAAAWCYWVGFEVEVTASRLALAYGAAPDRFSASCEYVERLRTVSINVAGTLQTQITPALALTSSGSCSASIALDSGAVRAEGRGRASLRYARRWQRVPQEGIGAEGVSCKVELNAEGGGAARVGVIVELQQAFVRLTVASDGFLAQLVGELNLGADLELSADSRSGLRFKVSNLRFAAGVSASASAGPLRVTLDLSVNTAPSLQIGVVLGVALSLGPVAVQITGITLALRALPPGSGSTAPFVLDAGLSPPTGISVRVDAGPVRGGGFITYDDALGRYSGALSLAIGDIALRAIGILDTRAPGVTGYSFLVVISAEFTPIQLGFGFTLTGVGGLCGIQRAVSVTALQEGVRSGTLASLLFSRDPIGQATQLIAGLQRAFPPTADRYVFGPMFKLGWGTPTLITADLGVVLQLPSPIIIALLGTLSAKIPRPEGAVVEINLDILGVLDLGEKKLSIDASLRDSRIAAFTLTGDLALRYSWGAEPDFALSLGGFNPAFRPPAGFPTLRRLSLALGSGNNPRLSLSAYFALTSNSLQFGARAEVYAEALGFNILGYLEFHALFIFSPFSFRFDFAAGVALRRGTSVLMAVSVVGRLEGPRPWHVLGSASISILFFEVTVSFDETFGDPPERARIEPVNLWDPLLAALRDLRNWSATLPSGTSRGVSTAADGEQPARVRLDPMSVLAVRQKVMPLDRRITKLGESPIEGPTRIRVGAVRVGCDTAGVGGTLVQHEALNEPFAAAQYESLNDAQRLSRPSFEPMAAGAQAQGRALATERPIVHRPRVETIRVGEIRSSVAQVLQRMHAQMAQVDSASVAALRTSGAERYAPGFGAVPMMTLAPEQWALASTHDLRAPTGSTGGTWGTVAEEARMRGDAGGWQVVPLHEVRR
jgi:hypothetical protein